MTERYAVVLNESGFLASVGEEYIPCFSSDIKRALTGTKEAAELLMEEVNKRFNPKLNLSVVLFDVVD